MNALTAPHETPCRHPVYFDDPDRAADYAVPHDLTVRYERRDARHVGVGPMTIRYARHNSEAIGPIIIAMHNDAICRILLCDETTALAELRTRWPGVGLTEDCAISVDLAAHIDAYWSGASDRLGDMPVNLAGTAFQLGVWDALLRIPMGACVSYAAIARAVGTPGAARAVGAAVAANPVALLVPCHRVVRAGGRIGGYAWGTARKEQLLATEAALVADNRSREAIYDGYEVYSALNLIERQYNSSDENRLMSALEEL